MEKTRSRFAWPQADHHAQSPDAKGAGKGEFRVSSLTLVGIGGIIGAGFFLASGMPIHQAGPAVVISYLIGALIMSQVLGSITSIAVNHPVEGSFMVYAKEMLGTYAGFLQGWVYYVSGILAITSEAVAMSIFTKFWLPFMPLPVLATIYVLIVVALNAFGVKNFEKIESFMSVIKIAALTGFILLALLAVFGWIGPSRTAGLQFTQGPGGFLPNGWQGIAKAMLIVIFSYAGIGVMASATNDTADPHKVIPKATTYVIIFLTLLYAGSTALLLMVFPWNQVNTDKSPFVAALDSLRIPFAGHIFNGIILIAAFSVMAGTLFSVIKILRSIALDNKAPRFVLKTTKGGKPIGAFLAIVVSLALFLALAYILPAKVYNYITSASAFFTFLNWSMILLSFIFWLRRKSKHGDYLSRWAFFKPYGQWLTLLVVVGLAVFSLWDPDQRVGFYYALGIFLVITAGYWVYKRRAVS